MTLPETFLITKTNGLFISLDSVSTDIVNARERNKQTNNQRDVTKDNFAVVISRLFCDVLLYRNSVLFFPVGRRGGMRG